MGRGLDQILRIFGGAVLAIVILSIVGGITPLGMHIQKAEAQGSMTLSSSNLNPLKWIVLTVTGYEPGANINMINIQATDAVTGAVINVLWANDTPSDYFTATRVSGTTFVAYVGGLNVSSPGPASRLPGVTDDSSFARLQLSEATDIGKTIVFTVVGTDIKAQVTFAPVPPTLAPTPIPDKPYRRDAIVPITITDPDLNKDPTAVDRIPVITTTVSNETVPNNTGYTLTYTYNSTTQILSISVSGNIKQALNGTNNVNLFWFNYIVPGSVRINITINNLNDTSGNLNLTDSRAGTTVGQLSRSGDSIPITFYGRIDYITGDFMFNASFVSSTPPTVSSTTAFRANFTEDGPLSSTVSGINVSITLVRAPENGGGSFSTPPLPLNRILLPDIGEIRETAVDSSAFPIRTSMKILSWVISKATSFTQYPGIAANDRVIIDILTTRGLQSNQSTQGWDDPVPGETFVKAIYTQPQISIDFKSTGIVINIASPDDNVNPASIDMLDTGIDYGFASSAVVIIPGPSGSPVTYAPEEISETGANTGVFGISLGVRWSSSITAPVLNKAEGIVYLPTGRDIRPSITVIYTTGNQRPAGYNIDASASATYTPTKANISLDRATTKVWSFTVVKPDINNNAGAVETLTAVPIGTGTFNLTTGYGAVVAMIQFTDDRGNPVNVPPGAISFSETDFNTGVFKLIVNATQVSPLTPGGQYILRYWDLAGFSMTNGLVELPFTVRGVAISFPGMAEVPINRVYGVHVLVLYSNDNYNRDPTAIDSASVVVTLTYVNGTTVTLYGSNGIVSTSPLVLSETDIDTGDFAGIIVLPPSLFSTPAIIDATLTVSDPIFGVRASIKIRPHAPTEFSINGSTAVALRMGDSIVIMLAEPDWNWRPYARDSVRVTVVPQRGSPFNITLTETGANTGVFTARIVVSWDDFNGTSFNGNVFPGDTVQIIYNDDTPALSPTATSWTTVPYIVQFKVLSTTGRIIPETSTPGAVGPLEKFNVLVDDPDLDRFISKADQYTPDNYVSLRGGIIALSIEGIPQVVYYSLNETGLHTGRFRSVTALSIEDVLKANNIILPTDDAWTRAAKVASFVGKRVLISYIDMIDETGARSVVNAVLTITASDASIATDKEFVNIGETLTITIINRDIAGTDVPEYKQVFISSTSIAVPQQFFLTEVRPGVFQVNITVVSPSDWIPGAPQIPAKIGDTITITYYDPVTANGSSKVPFTKQVIVGRFLERPAKVNSVDLLDPSTGAPVTPKVNVPVLIAVNLSNQDIIDRQMTVFVVVRDARNVTVSLFLATTTVPAGKSVVVGFQWIPFAAGNYTIEVIVVKAATDRTPLAAETFRKEITVSS